MSNYKQRQDDELQALRQFACDQLSYLSNQDARSRLSMQEQRPIYDYSDQRVVRGTNGSIDRSSVLTKKSLKTLQKKRLRARSKNEVDSIIADVSRINTKQMELPYQKNFKKVMLCRQVRDRLRKELHHMYRSAEVAYGAMDFNGLGYIAEQSFLDSMVVKSRMKDFSQSDMKLYFLENNLFPSDKPGISFDNFKKNFFPHLYLVQDDKDDADDTLAHDNKMEILKNKAGQAQVIEQRLMKLDKHLKIKFSNCFESVRTAFLALDTDYDGYVTVEDILKYFGNEKDLNYNDLNKLIMDRDEKGQGKLNYKDFSKWMGNQIKQCEGFYFRHDSVKNPGLDRFMQSQADNKAGDIQAAKDALMEGDIEDKILQKIKFQWKTLRKAFQDLNVEKTGKISKKELRYQLNFWGMEVSEEDFKKVFDKFDLDGDGMISYKDFQVSIGHEMFPAEGLYFRQDKEQIIKIKNCDHPQCWQPTLSKQNYCVIHQKMHHDEAIKIFTRCFNKIGKLWPQMIDELKNASTKDDESQILMSQFNKILDKFGVKLRPEDQEKILMVFPGGDSPQGKLINVARIYDQKYNLLLQKFYKKLDVSDVQGADEPEDINGYYGKTKFYREQVKLFPINIEQFIQIVAADNKIDSIMTVIREIDKDRNGYVTNNELTDIIKMIYPKELKAAILTPIIKKFASVANQILIDYKQFRDWIRLEVHEHLANQKASQIAYEGSAEKKIPLYSKVETKVERSESKRAQSANQVGKRSASVSHTSAKAQNLATAQDVVNQEQSTLDPQISYGQVEMKRPVTQIGNSRTQSRMRENYGTQQPVKSQFVSVKQYLNSKKGPGFTDQNSQKNLKEMDSLNKIHYESLYKNHYDEAQTIQNSSVNIKDKLVEQFYNTLNLHSTDDDTMVALMNYPINQSMQQEIYNQNKHDFSKTEGRLQTTVSKSRQEKQDQFNSTINKNDTQGLFSKRSYGMSSVFTRSKFEQNVALKLGYEWKNIYRVLTYNDKQNEGACSLKYFDLICQKHNVHLSNNDLTKLMKSFAEKVDVDGDATGFDEQVINYRKLSIQLGLHKQSYNYLKNIQNNNKSKNIQKLKQLFSSIDRQREIKDSSMMVDRKMSQGFYKGRNQQKMLKTAQTEMAFQRGGSQKYLEDGIILKTRNLEQDLQTLKLHNAKKLELTGRLQNQPFTPQKVHSYIRPHTQMLESEGMNEQKRESVNFMQKRKDSNLIPLKSSVAEVSPGPLTGSPRKSKITVTNRTMSDQEISNIIRNYDKLSQFKEMVILQIKKNDIQQQMITGGDLTNEKSIGLPVSSFRQCLNVIGIVISPEQLNKFIMRGDVSESASTTGNSKSYQIGNSGVSNKSGINSKIHAFVSKNGSRALGVNVNKFIQYYL